MLHVSGKDTAVQKLLSLLVPPIRKDFSIAFTLLEVRAQKLQGSISDI